MHNLTFKYSLKTVIFLVLLMGLHVLRRKVSCRAWGHTPKDSQECSAVPPLLQSNPAVAEPGHAKLSHKSQLLHREGFYIFASKTTDLELAEQASLHLPLDPFCSPFRCLSRKS